MQVGAQQPLRPLGERIGEGFPQRGEDGLVGACVGSTPSHPGCRPSPPGAPARCRAVSHWPRRPSAGRQCGRSGGTAPPGPGRAVPGSRCDSGGAGCGARPPAARRPAGGRCARQTRSGRSNGPLRDVRTRRAGPGRTGRAGGRGCWRSRQRGCRLRARELPQTSARIPAAMPWADPRPLVLMHFVGDQQVEPARQALLDVLGERIAAGAGAVGLPEGRRHSERRGLAAGQLRVRQGHAVRGDHLGGTDRARRDAEWRAAVLVPQQPPRRPWPSVGRRPAASDRRAWRARGRGWRRAGRGRRWRGAAAPGR